MKKLYLLFIISLSFHVSFGQGSSNQIGQTIFGGFDNARLSSNSKLSNDGNIIAISGADSQATGFREGYVRVYELINNEWIQRGQTLIGTQEFSRFGLSMALSSDGNILAVAAPSHDFNGIDSAGKVQVYEYDGANWVQKGQNLYGEQSLDILGAGLDLSLDGNRLLVGAISEQFGNGSGRVMIYEFQNDTWVQLGNTIQGDEITDNFGIVTSINADGTVVVVGAPATNFNVNSDGVVYAFSLVMDEWTQIGDPIPGEAIGDQFGTNVSINSEGNIIAASARFNSDIANNSGHIRIYENINGNWIQKGNDIDGEEMGEQLSTMKLDESGDILGISSSSNDGEGVNRGVIYVMEFINGEWIRVLMEIEGDNSDFFGSGFDMNLFANKISGGVIFDDTQNNNEGRVEVYDILLDALPEIFCGANINQDVVTNTCESIVNYDIPVAEDPEDGVLSVILIEGLPSGSLFPLGTTMITYEVIDSFGNAVSCSFTVTIVDNQAPEVTCPEDLILNAEGGNNFIVLEDYIDITDVDNCDDSITSSQNPVPGTELTVGSQTTVTITNIDDSGNEASCSFIVTVDESLSLNDNQFENDIVVFPNSFESQINIEIPLEYYISELNLFDINGRILRIKIPKLDQRRIKLETDNISSGTYFLMIRSNEHSVVKKLIKL